MTYSGGNADFVSANHRCIEGRSRLNGQVIPDSFRHRLYVVSPEADAPELEVLGVLGDDPEAAVANP